MNESELLSPDEEGQKKLLPGQNDEPQPIPPSYFPSSKSVENMESIQLESGQMYDSSSNLESDLSGMYLSASDLLNESKDAPDVTPAAKGLEELFGTPPTSSGQNIKEEQQPDTLAKYFGSGDTTGQDIFDSIKQPQETMAADTKEPPAEAAVASQDAEEVGADTVDGKQKTDGNEAKTTSRVRFTSESEEEERPGVGGVPEKGVEAEDEQAGELPSMLGERQHRERQISHSEEIPVSFEEEKGDPSKLAMAASTRNLFRFFSEDGSGAEGAADTSSADARKFFDSFTVSEREKQTAIVGDFVENPPSGEPSHTSLTSPPDPMDVVSPHASLGHISPTATNSVSSPGIQLPSTTDLADDPFYQILQTSDSDRRHDAWLPCVATRTALQGVGTPGSEAPVMADLTMLTRPQMSVLEGLNDPVRDMLLRFRGESEAANRHTLTTNDVPQNEDGIRQLITAECYRAAIDLTSRLIAQHKQQAIGGEHTPYEMQLWLVRVALLMKLRMYQEADPEVTSLGTLDQPDLYFEYYPATYPGRKGSMVPFHLRVLVAELPMYLGKSQEALDKLHYNLAIVQQILRNLREGLMEDGSPLTMSETSIQVSVELWESRMIKLFYCIANCLMTIKDYSSTLQVLENLETIDVQNKPDILCAQGRIRLQLGDIKRAKALFSSAESAFPTPMTPTAQSKCSLNRGFIALAEDRCEDAHQLFQKAVSEDSRNAAALNNMAVSAVYVGRLRDALRGLETLVQSNPDIYLHEGILFNLCTLYELESSQAQAKKLRLLDLAAKHKGDGFNIACLKLSSGL